MMSGGMPAAPDTVTVTLKVDSNVGSMAGSPVGAGEGAGGALSKPLGCRRSTGRSQEWRTPA